MEQRYATAPEQVPGFDTAALRQKYLVPGLFEPDQVHAVYSHQDRIVMLGAIPATAPLPLGTYPEIRSEFFLEHREIGLVNVGGAGTVEADGVTYDLVHAACLYLTRGTREVVFASSDPADPAAFYGFSAPAHTAFVNTLVAPGQGTVRELGDPLTSNRRTLNQYIHPGGVLSATIVMGVTTLHPGSMWNTMPAHTHDRRMESYLYFDLPDDARVIHLMGTPSETRHLVVANREGTISPSWSIHSGVGTSAYSFIWAMAGENQSFDDMDTFPVGTMK
jgi:4-deoxy-L-threo-5-hexosulose-uronate ketol-isomerase